MKRFHILLAILALAVGACTSSHSGGGQASHETKELTVQYDGVTIHDSREQIATTQPTISTTGSGQGGRIGASTEGNLSDVSLDTIKQKNTAGSIAVAVMFVLIGSGFGFMLWFTGRKAPALVIGSACIACAVLAFLYPWILAIVFVAVLLAAGAYVIWSVLYMKKQLVAGSSNALLTAEQIAPPQIVPKLKEAMAAEHDTSTQVAVEQALPNPKTLAGYKSAPPTPSAATTR